MFDFGELRSMLATPPTRGELDDLLALLELMLEADPERTIGTWLPYVASIATRWPAPVRDAFFSLVQRSMIEGTKELGALLPNPRVIDWSGWGVFAQRMIAALEHLPLDNLEELRLVDAADGDAIAAWAHRTPALAGLRVLDLRGAAMTDEGIHLLAGADHLAGLEELRLDHCQANEPALAGLFGRPWLMEGLKRLSLRRCPMGRGELARQLAAHGARLERLDLADCAPPADALAALVAPDALPALRSLSLANVPIPTAGFQHLGARPPQLTHLNLRGTGAGDEEVAAIAGGALARGLRVLNLKHNHIGADGASALASSEHLARLEVLRLSHNPLGDAGVAALARADGLPHLHTLLLANVDATMDALDALTGRVRGGVLRTLDVRYPQHPPRQRGWAGELGLMSCTELLRACDASFSLRASPPLRNLRRGDAQTLSLRGLWFGNAVRVQEVEVCLRRAAQRDVRHLDMSGTLQTRNRAALLDRILESPLLRRLETLDLSGNPLGVAQTDALLASRRLSGLRVLNLAHCKLTTAQTEALITAPALRHLERLELFGNPLPLHRVDQLRRSGDTRVLTPHFTHRNTRYNRQRAALDLLRDPPEGAFTIDLAEMHLSDDDAALIATLPGLATARSIDVSHHDIGIRGALAMVTSRFWREGMTVQGAHRSVRWYWRRRISDLFTTLSRHPRELDLSRCNVTAEDLEALGRWPGLANVSRLRLRYGTFPLRAVEHIARSRHLDRMRSIDVQHNVQFLAQVPRSVYQADLARLHDLLSRRDIELLC